MQKSDELVTAEFNPQFLYTWKGVRVKDEERYHMHERHMELAFIMSGRGRYRIDDKIYDIEEGDVLLLNPGSYHQALSDSQYPATEFFIGVNDFCFEGMKPCCIELKTMPVYKAGPELKQKLMKLCMLMDAERDYYRVGKYYMMQSYLVQFMLYLIRDEQEPKIMPKGRYLFESINKNEIVSKIIEYFTEHYQDKISLDMISENMYVSPFYISKIFKSITGDTPIRYLINIRLEKAKELLCDNPNLGITEAAEMVGYDDVYHFSKLFKKKFGVSPSKIRGIG